ncbi:RNA polymerase sigma factor [Sorangium sp. So ce117]|uniref:RNA polymerase sigma factor n=1 Tax=Sorangium sp. So ce117 TaxID=3133277 RepID=UPI003F5ECAD6
MLATLAGIPKRDRADVEQQVLVNAWNSVRRATYRPDPKARPRDALRKWLHGIAWRLASYHINSAWAPRAVLHPSPLGLLREPVEPSLEAQIAARQVLAALASLPDWQVEALLTVDDPESLAASARRRGMNQSTAASRLRLAREHERAYATAPDAGGGRDPRPAAPAHTLAAAPCRAASS